MSEVTSRFEAVVEVIEARTRRANEYLDAGYQLLSIQAMRRIVDHGQGPRAEQGFVYVLGRTASVEHHIAAEVPKESPEKEGEA